MRQDLHGLTAENRAGQPALTMRAHHDQIAAFLLGGIDNGAVGIRAAAVQQPRLHARAARIGNDVT